VVVKNPKIHDLEKGESYDKVCKTINTDKLLFDPDEFFWKNKVSVFNNQDVNGGGGAMYNIKRAEAAELMERLNNPKPKSNKNRVEPTLDRKGRINENIYDLYPGMYGTVKNRKENVPGQYEKNREVTDKVARIFKEFEKNRAP
jgi:hypothetical protein